MSAVLCVQHVQWLEQAQAGKSLQSEVRIFLADMRVLICRTRLPHRLANEHGQYPEEQRRRCLRRWPGCVVSPHQRSAHRHYQHHSVPACSASPLQHCESITRSSLLTSVPSLHPRNRHSSTGKSQHRQPTGSACLDEWPSALSIDYRQVLHAAHVLMSTRPLTARLGDGEAISADDRCQKVAGACSGLLCRLH